MTRLVRSFRVLLAFSLFFMLIWAAPSAVFAQTAGAPVPFVEFNAATSGGVQSNGGILGPDYNFGTLASEATGRQVRLLIGQGQYVSFTLTQPANAVTIHYAIPDTPGGGGTTEPLSLYVNGNFVTSLSLTSQYSWLYGSYTFSKTPSLGMPGFNAPHDFYNDARYLFPSTLPQGAVVTLQVDSGDNSPWYAINTADFEMAPAPIAQPSNAINVTQSPYNADNTGSSDSTTAIQNAIYAAESSGQVVYLPAGTYSIKGPLYVNNVTVEGAGEWYTVLTGSSVEFSGQISPASSNVNISHLALFGNVAVRNDGDGSVNGFNGGFSNSTISHVWIQNEKVGAWIVGPATNLTFNDLRILDLKADGINFNAADGAITSSEVENTFERNTQDDGVAMWAENAGDTDITVTQNTIDSPGLANNVAIYGSGDGDQITNNLLQDTVTRGGGIHIGQRFNSQAVSGTITISGNVLNRDGQFDPGFFFGVGALWFWPDQGNLDSTVNVVNNTFNDSPYPAIQFLGPDSTTNVTFNGNTINNAGTFAFAEQGAGAATVSNTSASGLGAAGIFDGTGTSGTFTLTDGGGNSGWSTTTTSYPAEAPLWVYPDVLTFENASVGQTTAALQIAVINKAEQVTSLGTISASSGFTVQQDPSYPCGSSLSAANFGGANENGWCLIDVTFTPSASGITTGTLTIPSSALDSPFVVQLVGSTGGNTLNSPATLSPTSLAFGSVYAGSSSVAQNVTLSNPSGQATISIGAISVSSGYTETNNCGSSLVGGSSCTISVTFAPTTSGTDNGTLSVPTSAAASPLTASLSGTGTPPVTLTPASVAFGYVSVGSSSSAQSVTVSNQGSAAASIGTISASSGYTETNNCGSSLAGGASCTISVAFAPTSGGADNGTLSVSTSVSSSPLTVSLSGTGITATTNLSLGAAMTASSEESSTYGPANSNDGNASTYWESLDGAGYPQWLDVNFGSVLGLGSVTLDLPPSTAWSTRTETLSVEASTDGSNYTTIVPSANYTFDPSTGNTVSFNLPSGTSSSHLRLVFTANTGWTAAQISEFEVFPGTSSCTVSAPAAPSGLSATAASSSQINLGWTASTTSGVTYSVFRSTASGFTPTSANQIANGLTGTSYSDSGVSASTTYYYIVEAVNCAGAAASSQASATTQSSCTASAPAAPSGLTATAASSSQINLSWTASSTSGVTYSVFRSISSGFTPSSSNQVASGLSGTSDSDSGLSASTTYYYIVEAVNCSGSAVSNQASATTNGGAEAPYGGTPWPLPGTVQAENFDTGGDNVAYYTTDNINHGGQYRTSEGVSIEATTDTGGGYDVGWTTAGQWMKYTVNVTASGGYVFNARVANTGTGADIYFEVDGTNVTGSMTIPDTGGWQTWTTISSNAVNLTAGQHVITLYEQTNGSNGTVGNYNWFSVTSAAPGIQIDAGGPASGSWLADEDYSGGNSASTTATIDTSLVANPAPQVVYQNERWGAMTYTIPGLTPGATYTVNLHFAETYWTAMGQREFNVLVNGAQVLTNYDIVAAAGAANKAIVAGIVTTANSSGQIVIQFTMGAADNPEVRGIEVVSGVAADADLALGATVAASSNATGYPAGNANDGNPLSYWESLDGAAYPQWLDVNVGTAEAMGSVTLNLPPLSGWSTRTETFSVEGSTDGVNYSTIVPSASYTFDPSTGNTVSVTLPAGTTERNLRLVFTGNTGWDAAQVSEVKIYP